MRPVETAWKPQTEAEGSRLKQLAGSIAPANAGRSGTQ